MLSLITALKDYGIQLTSEQGQVVGCIDYVSSPENGRKWRVLMHGKSYGSYRDLDAAKYRALAEHNEHSAG